MVGPFPTMPNFPFTPYHTIIPGRSSVPPLPLPVATASKWTHRGSLGLSAFLKGHLTIITLLCSDVLGTSRVEFAGLTIADCSNTNLTAATM